MGLLLGVMLSGDNHFIGEEHMSNQDDRYTLIEEIGKPPFYHMNNGVACYLDGAGIRHEVPPELTAMIESHLKQKIRTATFDEMDEVVESMSDYIHHNGFLFKRSLKERLDKLRGNDEHNAI